MDPKIEKPTTVNSLHNPTDVINAFLEECDKKTNEYINELEKRIIAHFGKPGASVVVRCNWKANADGGCDMRLDVSTYDEDGEPFIKNPPFYGVRITDGELEYLTHDGHDPHINDGEVCADRNGILLQGLMSVLNHGKVVDSKTGEPMSYHREQEPDLPVVHAWQFRKRIAEIIGLEATPRSLVYTAYLSTDASAVMTFTVCHALTKAAIRVAFVSEGAMTWSYCGTHDGTTEPPLIMLEHIAKLNIPGVRLIKGRLNTNTIKPQK